VSAGAASAGPAGRRALERRGASAPRVVVVGAIVIAAHVGMIVALVGAGEVVVHASAMSGLRHWDEIRVTACSAVVVLVVAVGVARVYRGMHHPGDVVVGGLMGFGALTVAGQAVRVASDDRRSRSHDADPEPASPHHQHARAVST
jgi:membrane-associated phospholipid phosphatase